MPSNLFDRAAKRFANSMRAVADYAEEVDHIQKRISAWSSEVSDIKTEDILQIEESLENLKSRLLALDSEMNTATLKLEESKEIIYEEVDRLATGAHIFYHKNRPYVLMADPDGFAEYLNSINPEMARAAFKKADQDKLLDLFMALKGHIGSK